MTKPVCSVENCTTESRIKGMCVTHYHRVWRNGDPHTVKRALTGTPLIDRVRSVGWTETDSGCWEWNGRRDENGYGVIKYENRNTRAHRAVWTALVGDIPEGKMLCHTCDNPPCVNPEHIFIGTNADNMADMKSKNRGRSGQAKLTPDKVREMKRLYATGNYTKKAIEQMFGMSGGMMTRITKGEIWRYVD